MIAPCSLVGSIHNMVDQTNNILLIYNMQYERLGISTTFFVVVITIPLELNLIITLMNYKAQATFPRTDEGRENNKICIY